jgi:hypothetical protein
MPHKSKVLSPEKIAIAAKSAGKEPKIVFKNLFIHIAYNQRHQLTVAKQPGSDLSQVRHKITGRQQYYQTLHCQIYVDQL